MTDRIHSLTVVLDKDVREDDAQKLIDAIGMFASVIDVTANVSDPASHMAQTRARQEAIAGLYKLAGDMMNGAKAGVHNG